MSIKFSGGTQAIAIAHNASLDVNASTTEFTISCWFKCPVGLSGSFVAKRGTSVNGIQVGVLNSGGNKLFTQFGTSGNLVSGFSTVDDNQWHHALFLNVFFSGAHRSVIFLDGSNDSTGNPASSVSTNTLDLLINARRAATNFDFGFVGSHTLADVRYWKGRSLDDTAIDSLYNGRGRVLDNENLTGWWKLNEGHPTKVASGSNSVKDPFGGFDGTPNSSPVYDEDIVNYGRPS